jgi:hypothetical protein
VTSTASGISFSFFSFEQQLLPSTIVKSKSATQPAKIRCA